MNKILIPTILAATILVAASFAFMPVQRAATTHLPSVTTTSIADGSVTSVKIADGTITGADIAAGGIDASGDFAAGVVNDAAIATGITVSKLGDTAGITDILVATQTLAGAVLAEGAREIVTVTMTGIDTTNDIVVCHISKNDDFDNIGVVEAEITGANTITAQVQNLNETAATVDVTTDATDAVMCIGFKRP